MIHKPPASTWADYRIRARLFWLLLLVGPFVALVTAELWLIEHYGLHGLVWSLAAWLGALLLAAWHWQSFRCPRCERRFFERRPLLLALRARRCINCMLSKE